MNNDLPALLSGIAGAVLSLGFTYIPGLSDWYGAQTKQVKQLIMLACLVLATLGAYAVTCWQLFSIPGLVCGEPGIRTLVAAFLVAMAVNQATYPLTTRA